MDIFLFILFFLLGCFALIPIAKKIDIRVKNLWLIWSLKLVYSLIYIYIYTTYYGEGNRIQGDSLHFMEDSRILNEYAQSEPLEYLEILVGLKGDEVELLNGPLARTNIWDYGDNGDFMNDNRLIIRINSVIYFFSTGNIYIHCLIFSFISLLGLILIYIAVSNWIELKKIFLFTICLLPSIGFFGSALTKESIVIFGIGLLIYSLKKINDHKLFSKFLILLFIALFISLFNKPYTGLIVAPLSFIVLAGKYLNWNTKWLYLFTFLIISTSVSLTYTPSKLNLTEKISYKQKDMNNLARGGVFFVTDSSFCAFDFNYIENFDTIGYSQIKVTKQTEGEYKLFGKYEFIPFTIYPSDSIYDVYLVNAPSNSYFETTRIENKSINLLLTIPECIFNTMVRPFPWDNGSSLKYITIFQNIGVLILIIITSFNLKKVNSEMKYWLLFFFLSSFIILLIIGWTTPVFGAIMRYKVPADLLLLTGLFILLKTKFN